MTTISLKSPKQRERNQMRRENRVSRILQSDKQERHTYIENNITDLDSAKEYLKALTDLVVVIGRSELSDD